jgi:hypothetical protein
MGWLDPIKTSAGKLFAGVYTSLSGIAFLGTASMLLA